MFAGVWVANFVLKFMAFRRALFVCAAFWVLSNIHGFGSMWASLCLRIVSMVWGILIHLPLSLWMFWLFCRGNRCMDLFILYSLDLPFPFHRSLVCVIPGGGVIVVIAVGGFLGLPVGVGGSGIIDEAIWLYILNFSFLRVFLVVCVSVVVVSFSILIVIDKSI